MMTTKFPHTTCRVKRRSKTIQGIEMPYHPRYLALASNRVFVEILSIGADSTNMKSLKESAGLYRQVKGQASSKSESMEMVLALGN